MNNSVNTINQVRQGTLLTPTTASSAPTVIELAEIYPYHRVRYPDREDLDKYLSNDPCAVPFNKVLEQILKAFEIHKLSFLPAGYPTPHDILNLAASLSLKVEEMQNNEPRKSMQNGLMYLNKILETSPYLQIHQFLVDSYLACTQVCQHVQTFFNYNGSTDNIKKQILKVYEEFLKWEVEIKETADRNHQQRTVNTVDTQASGQGNPIFQGPVGATGSQGGQIVQGSAGTMGSHGGQIVSVASGTLGVQTVQAFDPYAILGIRSLEQGGSVTDWDDAFENKLILLLGQFDLGLTESDEIFQLADELDDENDDEELSV